MPDNPAPVPQQQPETKQAPNFVKKYCNSVSMEVTPWEFTFTFGELKKSSPSSNMMFVEQMFALVTSPQLAKVFLNILADNVQQYEKNVGPISVPPTQPQEPKNEPAPATPAPSTKTQ